MKLTLMRCCHFSGIYLMKKNFFVFWQLHVVSFQTREHLSGFVFCPTCTPPAAPPPSEQQVCDQKASAEILKWTHYLSGGAFESNDLSENPKKMVCRVMKDMGWKVFGWLCVTPLTCWMNPITSEEQSMIVNGKHVYIYTHTHTPHTVY